MKNKKKYFGTDGIRGTVNTPPMTPTFAMQLGMAASISSAGETTVTPW